MNLHLVHLQWNINRFVSRHFSELSCLDSCYAFSKRFILVSKVEKVKWEKQVVLRLIVSQPSLSFLYGHAVSTSGISLRQTMLKANVSLLCNAGDRRTSHDYFWSIDAQSIWNDLFLVPLCNFLIHASELAWAIGHFKKRLLIVSFIIIIFSNCDEVTNALR